MDVHPVTNARFKVFVDANPQWSKAKVNAQYAVASYLSHWIGDDYPEGGEQRPVIYVSWYAAAAYAEWAGKRLTGAEWENAAPIAGTCTACPAHGPLPRQILRLRMPYRFSASSSLRAAILRTRE